MSKYHLVISTNNFEPYELHMMQCGTVGIGQLESTQSSIKMLNTPCSGSSMQTDGDVDWLHRNLSYQRQMRDVHGVFDMPVIEGAQGQESFLPRRNLVRSVQQKEAYSGRKRWHMREQYVWMTTEDKEGVLSRKRLNNLVQHLYIYDTDEALEHRVKRSLDLDINLIRKILRILENNPYVEVFKSLGYVPDLEEFSYVVKHTRCNIQA